MINIYDANETNFDHNGLATLNPISAEFSVDINGAWSLVVVLPYDREKKYTYLTENNLIIADLNCIREQTTRQMFRIYDIKRNLNTVTIIAFPVGMEATYDAPIEELNISSCSGSSAASTINSYLNDHDQDTYNVTSDVTNTSSSQYENTNLIAAISGSDDNSFVNKWGGEVVYDNFNIKILKEVGEDVRFPVRYGRNLTGLEYHVDVSNVITRVYPISSDDMRLHTYPNTEYPDGQTYVDGSHSASPYIRSAFIGVDYSLLDTNEKSYSNTAIATRRWTEELYDAIYNKAEELWNTAKDDLTNTYCPAYIQTLMEGDEGIIQYTQARYAYTNQAWQSLVKSLIKQGLEWIKKEKLADWQWITRQGWYYGTNNADGSMKNYAVNQYIYSYSEGKWYHFAESGLMDYDQSGMSQDTIDLYNTYAWHQDSTGWYYGDGVPGSGNYFTNCWVENSDGTHDWVGDDGYSVSERRDTEAWSWTNVDGWMYGESLQRYAKAEYIEVDKYLEYFGSDGYWHDWERVKADEMGWYQVNDATSPHNGKWWYGSKGRNYAHNEFVYVKVDGQWKEWWYDEEGWYDDSSSGDSSYDWHGDATSGYWFGEEDASTEDKSKYLHDCWAYIDDGTSEFGTYYWFNSNGYISGDATLAKQDWAWGDITDEVTGKHWFGNRDASFNRMWISNQWLEIDGEWYYFDADGYATKQEDKASEVVTWFSNTLYNAVTPTITAKLKEAYDLLYSQMEAWCSKQFEQGLDKPNVSITVDLVDLSKTTEYAEYQNLEKIYLGDSVECVDAVHGISSSERVVGLTYDVIRGYNTKVTIGQLGDSLSSILSVSYKGSGGGETKLIAGDNVVINGNVISVSGNTGAVIGLQDATYKGRSVVNGNVAVLDNVGTKVIANPEGTPTADLTKLRVEDVIYKLAEGGGLKYWTETDSQIYIEYEVEGISADTDGYIMDEARWYKNEGQSYYECFEFRKSNSVPCIIVACGYDNTKHFYLIGTSEEAVAWEYRCTYVSTEWKVPANTGAGGGTSSRTQELISFEYEGVTWYCSHGNTATGSQSSSFTSYPTFLSVSNWAYSWTAERTAKAIIDQINVKPTTTYKVGIGKSGNLLYLQKTGTVLYSITDEGVFNGSDFKADGTSLLTLINAKQDKLIEGSNIQIASDGKTISATDTTYEAYDGSNEGLVSPPTTTGSNRYLKEDGSWDIPSGGGGGSSVIANPTGTPTDTLNTIEIDDVIYEIVGGGGGNTIDEIWSGSETPSTSGTTITLDKPWSDYDMLVFNIANGTSYYSTPIIMTQDIDTSNHAKYIQNGYGGGRFEVVVTFLTDTTVKIERSSSSGVAVTYEKIYGLKFGEGGGSSSIKYSTEEQVVGEWIDGKPLYQKTVEIDGVYDGNASVDISANIPSNIDLRYAEAQWGYQYGGTWYYHSLGQYFNYPYENINTVKLSIGSVTVTIKAYLTIRYTKTTD